MNRGDNDVYDRIKKIQFLVYHFLHNIIRYLMQMGRLRESDKDFLDTLVRGLRSTGGRPADRGGIPLDNDLADKLRDAYDTIAKLERKNHFLLEILESMKMTYEFFESSNDQKVLMNGQYPDNIFKQG